MHKKIVLCFLLYLLAGCAAGIPKAALQLPPESLANRQMQTRWYETGNTKAVLAASAAVLQDIGFNIDEAETGLGVVVASKNRDASDQGEIILLAVLGALGNNPNAVNSADATQLVKVALVVRSIKSSQNENDIKLSQAEITQIQEKVHSAIYEGLKERFGTKVCEDVAKTIANNTANTLKNDLETLVSVKDAPGKTAVRVTFQQVIFNTIGQINSQKQINDEKIYQEFFEKLSKSLFLEANAI